MKIFSQVFTIVLISISVGLLGAQDSDMNLVDLAESVSISANYTFEQTTISNLGDMIAWFNNEEYLCLFEYSNSETECYALPVSKEYLVRSGTLSGTSLQWSSTDEWIAVAPSHSIAYDLPTKVWVFSVASRQFIEQPEGSPSSIVKVQQYLPFWHPVDDILYYFQFSPVANSVTDDRVHSLVMEDVNNHTTTVLELPKTFTSYILGASASPNSGRIAMGAVTEGSGRSAIHIFDIVEHQFYDRIPILTEDAANGIDETTLLTFTSDIYWLDDESLLLNALSPRRSNFYRLHIPTEKYASLINLRAEQDRFNERLFPTDLVIDSDAQVAYMVVTRESVNEKMIYRIDLSKDEIDSGIAISPFELYTSPSNSMISYLSASDRAIIAGRTLLEVQQSE